MLVKQGTFLYDVWPDSADKRDIFNMGRKFGLVKEFDSRDLFIGELFVTDECRTLNFWTVKHLWIEGKGKENRYTRN